MVVQFVNVIRILRIIQWFNTSTAANPGCKSIFLTSNLFSYMYTSRLDSPNFGSLGVINDELEREECSSVSTAFVLDLTPDI